MLLQTILIMTTSSEKVDLAVFIEVAEKILNKEELEFYKWNGDLSQLLQNVREKLNRVAENWTREENPVWKKQRSHSSYQEISSI